MATDRTFFCFSQPIHSWICWVVVANTTISRSSPRPAGAHTNISRLPMSMPATSDWMTPSREPGSTLAAARPFGFFILTPQNARRPRGKTSNSHLEDNPEGLRYCSITERSQAEAGAQGTNAIRTVAAAFVLLSDYLTPDSSCPLVSHLFHLPPRQRPPLKHVLPPGFHDLWWPSGAWGQAWRPGHSVRRLM